MFGEMFGNRIQNLRTQYGGIYKVFSSKNALSEETAIAFNDELLKELGLTQREFDLFTKQPFRLGGSVLKAITSPIMVVNGSKFWFSVQKLQRFQLNTFLYLMFICLLFTPWLLIATYAMFKLRYNI